MAAGAAIIWTAVVSLGAVLRARTSPIGCSAPHAAAHRRRRRRLAGGRPERSAGVRAVVASAARRRAAAGHLAIAVSGEQWWWRVRYMMADGGYVELANEIRLPVGERIEVTLTSDNVIHSFWIPAISGKVDMIPGRTTHLSLEPTRTGIFRGTCAEYCGTSHALMAFPVVVLEKDAFERWLVRSSLDRRRSRRPRRPRAGRELFLANGCGACHTIRGTSSAGVDRSGPDARRRPREPRRRDPAERDAADGRLDRRARTHQAWRAHARVRHARH